MKFIKETKNKRGQQLQASKPRNATQRTVEQEKKNDNNKHLLSFRPAERKSDTLYFSGAVNQVQCVFHQPTF